MNKNVQRLLLNYMTIHTLYYSGKILKKFKSLVFGVYESIEITHEISMIHCYLNIMMD